MKTWKRKYAAQKSMARKRGIGFTLTFDEWMEWWIATGKAHLRGRRRGEYQMARHRDQGAYEIGNILCLTVSENSRAPHLGKPRPQSVKDRLSKGQQALAQKLGVAERDRAPKNSNRVAAGKRRFEKVKADPLLYAKWQEMARMGGLAKTPWNAGHSYK